MSLQVQDDFFGQFIRPNIRVLRRKDVQRFIDRLFILCPECYRSLPVVPTSDDFLICSFCNIHWDLLENRQVERELNVRVVSTLGSDGKLKRRVVPLSGQFNLDGGVE